MIKKIGIFAGVGFGAALIGGGIATGIILPKALKAKEGLENFVANGGSYNSLSNKKKINIVTIGDSESAGLVGYLGKEYRSYADFMAKSFKNAGRLGKYHNFAKSGERLSDIKRDVFEDASIMRQIAGQKDKDGNKIKGTGADLITITIGANDILAYLKVLHIPFNSFLHGFLTSDKSGAISKYPGTLKETTDANGVITQKVDFPTKDSSLNDQWADLMTKSSEARGRLSQSADTERTAIFGDNTGLDMDKLDSYNEFEDSINDLKNMFAGKNESLLNLDKDWFPKIYDLVKREMMVLVRDLHEANPDAQIIVLGHAFPFGQMDKKVADNKKPELDNTSLRENFERLLDSMKDGADENIDGNGNKFVSFYKVDDFAKFHALFKKLNFSDSSKFRESVIGNAMPNITDIHPSVLGYDMIGESLYDIYGKEAGIKDIKTTTQHSYKAGTKDNPATTNVNETLWARNDEFYDESSRANKEMWDQRYNLASQLSEISNIGGLFPKKIAGLILPILNQILSKDNNVKLKSSDMMTTVQKLIAKNEVLSQIPGISALLKNYGSALFVPLQEIGDIVGAVRTQLKEGLNDENVKEVEMFKLTQWGLHSIFDKTLAAQQQLQSYLPLLSGYIK